MFGKTHKIMKKKVITIGGIAIAVSIIGTEISVNEEGNKMNTYSFIYTINIFSSHFNFIGNFFTI